MHVCVYVCVCVCGWVWVCYKLINMNSHLALLATHFLNSILASVARCTLGADLAGYRFHGNPDYVICAHKTMM